MHGNVRFGQGLLPHKKRETFVVYNHLFKSKQTLIDSIIVFYDRTIRLISIKYIQTGYCRSFFKRSTQFFDKYYREEPNGSDIIFDHRDKQILGSWMANYRRYGLRKFLLAKIIKVLITDTATISIYSLSQLVNENRNKKHDNEKLNLLSLLFIAST